MQQILPTEATIADSLIATVDATHRAANRSRPLRPWVAMVMIASLDGSPVVDGQSGGLGNDADHRAFLAMRYSSDAIVVGAETVRAENYGVPAARPEIAAWRTQHGLAPSPLLVIVSGSLEFARNTRLFEHPGRQPLIVTGTGADADRLAAMQGRAEILQLEEVTATTIIDALFARGITTIALEGGPGVNAEFVQEGLIDEIQLSLAPKLVGGDGPRIVRSTKAVDANFDLVQLCHSDGLLIARYVRPQDPSA